MYRTRRSTVRIAAGGIVPASSRASCEPNVEGVEEYTVGIIWIHYNSLVVPVLGIVACAVLAVSERAALGTLHEGPACTTIRRCPGADLAARSAAAAAVAVTNNRLYLGIDVIRVTWSDSNIDSAQLVTRVDINKGRAAASIHWRPSRIGAAADRITKYKSVGIAGNRSKARATARSHRGAVDAVGAVQIQIVLHWCGKAACPNRCDNARSPASQVR
jgi:hypothetical protein